MAKNKTASVKKSTQKQKTVEISTPPDKPVEKPTEQKPKPKIEKVYSISFEEGNLSESHVINRCFVVDDDKTEVINVEDKLVTPGFGQSRQAALQDFLNRNNVEVINRIFKGN